MGNHRRIYQWSVLALGWALGGLSWPAMFWRQDERRFVANNAMLDEADADGDQSDGIEEAFWRVQEKGRFLHDVKNVGHEWFRRNPKFAFKFSGFVIVVLLVLATWGLIT